MNCMKNKLSLLLMLSVCWLAGQSQESPKQRALAIIRQLMQTYKSPLGLSFDVNFKYSDEKNPSVGLDSLSGQCRIIGDRYWYRIDSTESIRTPEYQIMFFKEDGLMYLSRPLGKPGNDPVAMIDSLLLQNANVTAVISDAQQYRSVVINFPAQSEQKQVEYRIDRQTGYLRSIVNVVRSEHMGEQATNPGPGDAPQFAIVEVQFTNYRPGGVDAGIFDTSRYFKKQGKEYLAVAPYDHYTILLGTPDM